MILKRHLDWEHRLGRLLVLLQDKRFAWGDHDCVTVAGNSVIAMTDVDLLVGFRNTYSSQPEAINEMARLGGLEKATLDTLAKAGHPLISWKRAHRGDIAMVPSKIMPAFPVALGIVVDDRIVSAGLIGIGYYPITAALHIWEL